MATTPKYMAVQGAALIMAAVLIALGVLGFVPGVTTDLGRLEWAGHQSGAKLFAVFAVSALHNLVHLVTGALGIPMARSYRAARAYLLGVGLVYIGLWWHGMLVGPTEAANVLPVNDAGNWLHFGLGVTLVLLALTLAGQHDPTKPREGSRA